MLQIACATADNPLDELRSKRNQALIIRQNVRKRLENLYFELNVGVSFLRFSDRLGSQNDVWDQFLTQFSTF